MVTTTQLQTTGIDFNDFANTTMLQNLQGNILKGHGREHTTHIFLKFDKGRIATAKDFLKHFAYGNITSFYKQLEERENYKKDKIKGGLFNTVLLTKTGLDYLEIKQHPTDEAFEQGMKKRGNKLLADPELKYQEVPFTEDIHAMILLADDDELKLAMAAQVLLDKLDKFSRILTIEYGHTIRNANNDGLEHNGYADGISQPLFLKDEIESYIEKHRISDITKAAFNPTAEKELVLIKDPLANNLPDCFGSYFVFRKLEQNVKAFKTAEENIGKKLFPNDSDKDKREIVGAMLVGRFEDGTPVTLQDVDGMHNASKFNNFDYTTDQAGSKCPYFAHTRKVTPRENEDQKSRMLARRGITYGKREVSTELEDINIHQYPTKNVGLLFMSYQASIVDQFEFIQQSWANNADFNNNAPTTKQPVGVDPIIGQTQQKRPDQNYQFPDPWGSSKVQLHSFAQFTTMKGGEYFYAPSIPFFKNLK